MLYITDSNKNDKSGEKWVGWHVGEPLPLIAGQVVTFQADGDELELILDALKGKQ